MPHSEDFLVARTGGVGSGPKFSGSKHEMSIEQQMDLVDDQKITEQERRLGVEQKASINMPEKRMSLEDTPGLLGNSPGQQAQETDQYDIPAGFAKTVNAWRHPNPNSIRLY